MVKQKKKKARKGEEKQDRRIKKEP